MSRRFSRAWWYELLRFLSTAGLGVSSDDHQ